MQAAILYSTVPVPTNYLACKAEFLHTLDTYTCTHTHTEVPKCLLNCRCIQIEQLTRDAYLAYHAERYQVQLIDNYAKKKDNNKKKNWL